MEAVKHYQETPGKLYTKLIELCYNTIDMKNTRKLSRAAMSIWFSEKKRKEHAIESEINPFKLAAICFQGTHFLKLEDGLFALSVAVSHARLAASPAGFYGCGMCDILTYDIM